MDRHCCAITEGMTCSSPPAFEIRAVRDLPAPPFVGIAGPDPYADDLHACEAHVGDLLTFQTERPRDPPHRLPRVAPRYAPAGGVAQ